MIAQLHRAPAHVDRADWHYEHITAPRPGCMADPRRRVTHIISNLWIGDEAKLPDGRRVVREGVNVYDVYSARYVLVASCTAAEILPYLLDGKTASGKIPTANRRRQLKEKLAPRKSRYRGVGFNRRNGKWFARIGWQTRSYKLPGRHTEEEAAADYDRFIREHNITDRLPNFDLEDAA